MNRAGPPQRVLVKDGSGGISRGLAGVLLVLCLAASFGIPYGAVSLMEAYENREWAKTGLSGAEKDEWQREKISRRLAIRFHNAGFKPPHATIWIREGFAPEEAGMWHSSGFAAHEAISWDKAGFAPAEAAKWKEAGFYSGLAGDWQKKGVSPEEAAARQKKGIFP